MPGSFTPFVAGQRVTAGELNGNSKQLIAGQNVATPAASFSLAVPSGYNRIQGYFTGKSSNASAAVSVRIQFNGDTGANYNFIYTQSNNGATSTLDNTGQIAILAATIPGATSTANYSGSGNFIVDNIGGGGFFPTLVSTGTGFVTTANMYNGVYTGQWLSTAAVTSVQFTLNLGNWVATSAFSLWGIS